MYEWHAQRLDPANTLPPHKSRAGSWRVAMRSLLYNSCRAIASRKTMLMRVRLMAAMRVVELAVSLLGEATGSSLE
ncbi:MAG: hypothetical protein NVSMB42_15800 [Herpetosiphon sp.]